jgi:hypothetical protein
MATPKPSSQYVRKDLVFSNNFNFIDFYSTADHGLVITSLFTSTALDFVRTDLHNKLFRKNSLKCVCLFVYLFASEVCMIRGYKAWISSSSCHTFSVSV